MPEWTVETTGAVGDGMLDLHSTAQDLDLECRREL